MKASAKVVTRPGYGFDVSDFSSLGLGNTVRITAKAALRNLMQVSHINRPSKTAFASDVLPVVAGNA